MGQSMVMQGSQLSAPRPAWAGAGTAVFITTAILGSAAASLVVTVPPVNDESFLDRISQAAYVLGFAILAITGAILIHRNHRSRMGWLLAGAGLTQLAANVLMGSVVLAELSGTRPPDLALSATNWLWVPAQLLVILVLLRFPNGNLAGRPFKFIEAAAIAWGVLTALATALTPGPLGATPLEHIDNPIGWSALTSVTSPLLTVLFTALPVLNVLAALSLVWRWRSSSIENRQRLRWIAAAAITVAITSTLVLLGTDLAEVPLAIASVILPAAVAVAILRHRLWELGVVARATLAGGLTALGLLIAYAATVRVFPGDYVPAIAGLFVAAAATPSYLGLRFLIRRYLLGTVGDPESIATRIRSQSNRSVQAVLDTAAASLSKTLRLPWVAIESNTSNTSNQPAPLAHAGRAPTDTRKTHAVPLIVGGLSVGTLRAAERVPGEGLSSRDIRMLESVAEAVAPLVHGLVTERHVETIREEERNRLQRDLHDGLGPILGAITMQAEATRNLVQSDADPTKITAQLERIGDNSVAAVAEVRRLIQELQPSHLADAGLTLALQRTVPELAGALASEVALDLPAVLDPRIEIAAYRIVLEAVRNAARHAKATRVTVDGRVISGTLMFTIADDGIGLGDSRPGVGMRAMRDRAESLGGAVAFEPGPEGGCLVRLVLPTVLPLVRSTEQEVAP